MHKYWILFVCLSAFRLNVSAQMSDLEITWGERFETPRRSFVTSVIDGDSSGLFAIRERLRIFGSEYYIERYVDLYPEKMIEQEINKNRAQEYSKEILKIGRDLWELTYENDRVQKKLTARYFDKEKLKPSGDLIEIFNIPIYRKLRYTYGSFDYNYSSDRSKTVFVTEYPGDYDEEAKLGIQVRDELFYLIWEAELTLPYPKSRLDLEYSGVNDEGLTVFMLRVYEESRMGADHRGQEYTYEMITLDSNGKMSKFLIDLDEYVIHSGHFEILDTSTLVCGGFYGEKRSQIDGSFYLRIDLQNGEELSSSTRKFDLAFLQEGQSAMKAKRISRKLERGKNAGLVNIYFRDFVLRSDGGVCLIGEYYDLIVTQGNDPNSSSTTSYVYKDIVVISMDPDGHVQWSKKILKRQITTEDGGLMSGFALLAHGDKLYFIFNDHKMNLEVKDYADLRTWSRKRRTSIVTLVTINSEGDLSREMLISQKKLRLELIPMSCRQISENEMILVAYSRKENQIARLIAR